LRLIRLIAFDAFDSFDEVGVAAPNQTNPRNLNERRDLAPEISFNALRHSAGSRGYPIQP
jgi:hypothetical protein